jgi:hypothetical protein
MRWAAALIAAVALLPAPASARMSAPAASPALSPPLPTTASAVATSATGVSAATDPNELRTPPSVSIPPPGHRLTAQRAIALAEAVPKIARVRRTHPGAYPTAYLKGATQWQVSIFSRTREEIGQVAIDDTSGTVLEAWTGYQVAWTMARGYDGAFGRRVNAWYVWIPLCVLFVAPFLPWRSSTARGLASPCRSPTRRSSTC